MDNTRDDNTKQNEIDQQIEQIGEKQVAKVDRAGRKMQSNYALPASSPESLVNILKAYVIASNQGTVAVNYSDVAAVAAMAAGTVSRNNAFLAECGFILVERYGYFKPSPETIEFAKSAPWDETGAKQYLRKIIDKTWFGQIVQQLFQLHKALTKSQLVKAFGLKATPDPSDANRLEFVIDLLRYVDYLSEDGDGNFTKSPIPEDEFQTPPTVDAAIDLVMQGEPPSSVVNRLLERDVSETLAMRIVAHVNINLAISASTTDDELERVVAKARSAIQLLMKPTE